MRQGMLAKRSMHSFYLSSVVVLLEEVKQRTEEECKRGQRSMHRSLGNRKYQHTRHEQQLDINTSRDHCKSIAGSSTAEERPLSKGGN
jgi:hypothetical protein